MKERSFSLKESLLENYDVIDFDILVLIFDIFRRVISVPECVLLMYRTCLNEASDKIGTFWRFLRKKWQNYWNRQIAPVLRLLRR